MKNIYVLKLSRESFETIDRNGNSDLRDRYRRFIYFQRKLEEVIGNNSTMYFETKESAEDYLKSKIGAFLRENEGMEHYNDDKDSDFYGTTEKFYALDHSITRSSEEYFADRVVFKVIRTNKVSEEHNYICINSWSFHIEELELN